MNCNLPTSMAPNAALIWAMQCACMQLALHERNDTDCKIQLYKLDFILGDFVGGTLWTHHTRARVMQVVQRREGVARPKKMMGRREKHGVPWRRKVSLGR